MKKLLALLSTLVLSACATPAVQVNNVPTALVINHPVHPAPVVLNNINWQVVTKNNIDTFANKAMTVQGTNNPVFIIITPDDYKTMVANLAELHRYIQQQGAIISYYEKATPNPTPNSTTLSASKSN